jgi:hypothetical protein
MARAECGTMFDEGDLMFNYYDMKPVVVGKGDDWNGVIWYQCRNFDKETHEPLGSVLLDGSRMCSLRFAVRRNFITRDQALEFYRSQGREVATI